MLEVRGTIRKKVAEGVDVKAMHVSESQPTRKVITSLGEQWVDNYVPTYTDGLPFGAVIYPVLAPTNLKAGDVLVVDADTGGALRVERDGEEVHTSDLQTQYREEAEDRDARREEIRRRRLENRI